MSSTAACPSEVNRTTPFADRLVQIINGGALLILGIGHLRPLPIRLHAENEWSRYRSHVPTLAPNHWSQWP